MRHSHGLRAAAGASEEVDPLFSQVSLLLHMNGIEGNTSFTDNSLAANTVTVTGDVVTSKVQTKFGGGSAFFNGPLVGTNDGLSFPEITFTGDFTIECWIYSNFGFDAQVLGASSQGGYQLLRIHSPTVEDIAVNADPLNIGGPSNLSIFVTQVIKVNTWHHVAICRSGANTRLFVDGTQRGATDSNYTQNGGAIKFGLIGRWWDFTEDLRNYRGYIEDVRATAAARYTANFIPPNKSFPNQ